MMTPTKDEQAHSFRKKDTQMVEVSRHIIAGSVRRFLAPMALGVAVICVLSACTGSTSATQMSGGLQTVPIAEGASAREALAQSVGDIKWIEATAAGSEWNSYRQAPPAVGQALRTAFTSLAAVDYAALSLPAFVTVTRDLKLDGTQFDSGEITPDAFGEGQQGQKWALYGWQGPEFPQLPGRELVHRWVYAFIAYDVTNSQVTHIYPTIRGEVWE